MPEQPTAACGAVRDVLPCVLDADHHDAYHQDVYGYRWPTATAEQATAEPEQAEADPGRLILLDGRDALAAVIIRPVDGDPESISVEANARGMSKAAAAYALRQTADEFDRAAAAEGDEPITPEEAAAEQAHRAEQAPAAPSRALDALARALLAEHRAPTRAAAEHAARHALDEYDREQAARIYALGNARGWSIWAADYIHPDREFIDSQADDDRAEQNGASK